MIESELMGRTVEMIYDQGNRLQVEKEAKEGGALRITTYGYDAANNRTKKTVQGSGVSESYRYNGLNQLVERIGGRNGTYTYDANGNRQTGRMGGEEAVTYTYDEENRLVGVSGGGQPALNFAYDYRGRRVKRTAGAETKTVVFSGGTSVQERPTSGGQMTEYIRGSDWGGGVGGILYSLPAVSFYHYNHRGDVTTETDGAGQPSWTGQYEAFGTRTAEEGTKLNRQSANTKDEEPGGLLNEGFRYRDLETGTFLTRDPAGFIDGPNLYAYVRQNPWSKFDPEGLATKDHDYEWQHNIPKGKASELAEKAGIRRNASAWGTYMTKGDHRLVEGDDIHTTGADGTKPTWQGRMNQWAEDWEAETPARLPTEKDFRNQIESLKKDPAFSQQFERSVAAQLDYKEWKELESSAKQTHAREQAKVRSKAILGKGGSNIGGKVAISTGAGLLFSYTMGEAYGGNADLAKSLGNDFKTYHNTIAAGRDVGDLPTQIAVKMRDLFSNEPAALKVWEKLENNRPSR